MAMKTYNFKVVLEPDEDFDGNPSGWHVYCPALEKLGGSTWGETREEALKNINEVVRMIVEEFVEEGKPLPEGPKDSVEVEAMDYRSLHALTARELIAALTRDVFILSAKPVLTSVTAIRTAGEPP